MLFIIIVAIIIAAIGLILLVNRFGQEATTDRATDYLREHEDEINAEFAEAFPALTVDYWKNKALNKIARH